MKRTYFLITSAIAALLIAPLASAQDPFGNPAKAKKPAKKNQPAQHDPFAPGPPPPAKRSTTEPPAEARKDISIRYEVFSLDLAKAAKLLRNKFPDAKLYDALVGMLEKEEAIQENFTVLRTKMAQRSSAWSSFEYIYPTEWDPAELPNSLGVKIDPPTDAQGKTTGGSPNLSALDAAQSLEELPQFVTPATPTAFETRYLGFSFEIETNAGENGLLAANIAPEHVALANLSKWGQGVSMLEMPEIESQRISTQVLLVRGKPRLVGTINRPPVSKVDPEGATRIWFAFITASDVK